VRVLFASFAAVALGCSDLPVAGEGEHVVVRTELAWCEDTTAWTDDAIERIAAWLGVTEIPRVTVRRAETAGEVLDACGYPRPEGLVPNALVGCAPGNDVWTNVDVHPHELVHAVAFEVGEPPAWLIEGLAEVIGGDLGLGAITPAVTPDRALLLSIGSDASFHDPDADVALHYRLAASFVRTLLETIGREALIELYAELDGGDGFDRVDALVRAYGTTLDEILTAWEARGTRTYPEIIVPVLGCDAPALDGPATLRSSESALLRFSREPRAVRSARFDARGWAAASIDTSDCPLGAGITAYGCGRQLPPAQHLFFTGTTGRLVFPVEADTYFFELFGLAPAESRFACPASCTAEGHVDALASDECGPRVPIAPGELVHVVGATQLVLEGEARAELQLWTWGSSAGAFVTELCELDAPCGRPTTCMPIPLYGGEPLRITPRSASLAISLTPSAPGGQTPLYVAR
jgi:hypothetical protein